LDDAFYRTWCGARLAPVLENILTMRAAGVHVEITNLLIPGLNDAEEQVVALCDWMVENGLQRVPLHFSRYFPRYKMASPGPTPKASLLRAREIARSMEIETVYLGNV
jgi:pyruvate formate lyase activating enzyme